MNNFITKIIPFIKLYKWLLLPIVPMFLFFGVLILFFSSSTSQTTDTTPSGISPSGSIESKISQQPENEILEPEFDTDQESRPDFLKKETLDNESTRYFFTSGNSDRPNILILSKDNDLIFSRTLATTALPIIPLSIIKEDFGEPEKVIQGSSFYGQQVNVYIYASSGVAFVANPQTDETLEEQRFQPMSVDEYVQRFKTQN